ncbi:MAG: CapA family protein [Sedimentisphaerales bacterium]|nr:CapA family protein [Sedimentisphaerales bacterium]
MKTSDESHTIVRLAVVGDLLLTTFPLGETPSRDIDAALCNMREVFQKQDIVLANLESTLSGEGETVPTQPRLIATPDMIRSVRNTGINLVTLANNHAFDCRTEGFRRLRSLLDELKLDYFGAGLTLTEAAAPKIITANGVRLGFITACDPQTGISDIAGTDTFGIPPLEAEVLSEKIRQLKDQAHHVIVVLHWGEERLTLPSPRQIKLARQLAQAGAGLIVGHHPHILQGMEVYEGTPICYSLGNFLSSGVYFTDGDVITWNRREQTGCIVLAEFDTQKLLSIEQLPTYDPGDSVIVDKSGFGRRWIDRLNRLLERDVTPRRYRWEQFRVNTLRPTLAYLRWSRLKTLRWRQCRNAFAGIWRTLREKHD